MNKRMILSVIAASAMVSVQGQVMPVETKTLPLPLKNDQKRVFAPFIPVTIVNLRTYHTEKTPFTEADEKTFLKRSLEGSVNMDLSNAFRGSETQAFLKLYVGEQLGKAVENIATQLENARDKYGEQWLEKWQEESNQNIEAEKAYCRRMAEKSNDMTGLEAIGWTTVEKLDVVTARQKHVDNVAESKRALVWLIANELSLFQKTPAKEQLRQAVWTAHNKALQLEGPAAQEADPFELPKNIDYKERVRFMEIIMDADCEHPLSRESYEKQMKDRHEKWKQQGNNASPQTSQSPTSSGVIRFC